MDRDSLLAAAAHAHSQGRLEEAIANAKRILDSAPDDLEAMLLVGIISVQRNDPAVAVPTLERLLELDPSSADGPFWLSMILRRHGGLPQALEMAQRAVDLNSRNEHAQNQLGMCQLDLGRREEALGSFQRAIELDPKVGPFFDNLGRALQSLGRNSEAIQAFRQVLAIGPVRPAALFRLGDAYMQEPNALAAEQCARGILNMDPQSVQGNLLLARALIGDGRVAEGAEYALKTVGLAPTNAVPAAYYGRALQSLGKIAEADVQFKRSIELEPRQGFAYHALVHNHKVKEDERAMVEKMEELSRDSGLPRREIIQLEYGLGKALEDLGDYESAMVHFDQANRIDHELKVGVTPFSKDQLRETADFLISKFDAQFLETHRSSGSESDLPIFVVGMMRSGTTLAEQILSSHTEIGGAGEQLFWPDNAGSSEKLFGSRGASGPLDLVRLQALSRSYLDLLSKIAPGKQRVVDKMNTNYLLLGLLNIAFPNAKIIHMKRHPVDTCLSIWATPVANGIDLCGDKENVVFAYQQYLRIMEHYRSILPSDRFMDVQYEELVSDRDRVTREMIEFCGLPWDEACMKPEDNTRSVKTPSVWQVRQPVYKTSMERWRKYEPWLGAFSALFESA
jgi:tetratricopeptide (TPR) repeat protein